MFRPLLFIVAGLLMLPSIALASECGSLFLQANALDFVADRARMIQVSLIAVAIGIGILWWKR